MKHKQKTLSRQVGKGIFLAGAKGAPSQSRRMVNKIHPPHASQQAIRSTPGRVGMNVPRQDRRGTGPSQTGKGFFNDLWDSATTPSNVLGAASMIPSPLTLPLAGAAGIAKLTGNGVKSVGTKKEVYNGIALKTKGGLKKQDLMVNKRGKVVSKKQHAHGKKMYAKNQLSLKSLAPR